MAYLKLVVLLLGAITTYKLFSIWRAGRRLAEGEYSDDVVVILHKFEVGIFGMALGFTVVVIECLVRLSPAPYASGPLVMSFHLTVAVIMLVVFFAIILHYTGLRSPLWHRRLVYSFLGFYVLTFVTGAVMLYYLPL
jgi:hypothetical protein